MPTAGRAVSGSVCEPHVHASQYSADNLEPGFTSEPGFPGLGADNRPYGRGWLYGLDELVPVTSTVRSALQALFCLADWLLSELGLSLIFSEARVQLSLGHWCPPHR